MDSQRLRLFNKFESTGLSDQNEEALEQYILDGLPPGSFYGALMAGDLYTAAIKSDHWNKALLGPLSQWILHNAPKECYGSYEVVQEWLDDNNGIRTKFVETISKKQMWEKLND